MDFPTFCDLAARLMRCPAAPYHEELVRAETERICAEHALHHEQDEWFYALEGEFQFEIGEERMTLRAGDSAFGPRRVPHVWACTGNGVGRMLIVFAPAGKMEAFFQETTKANAMPPQDPALWRRYGMELLGPPLVV